MDDKYLAKLRTLFSQVFDRDLDLSSLNYDTRLVQDLGMNSVGLLYMALALEEEFSVQFENEDLQQLTSVGSVIRWLKERGVSL